MNAQELVTRFKNTFAQKRQGIYVPVWNKEGRVMSILKSNVPEVKLMKAIDVFLSYPPEFWGIYQHTIFNFSKCINAVLRVMEDQPKDHPHLKRF